MQTVSIVQTRSILGLCLWEYTSVGQEFFERSASLFWVCKMFHLMKLQQFNPYLLLIKYFNLNLKILKRNSPRNAPSQKWGKLNGNSMLHRRERDAWELERWIAPWSHMVTWNYNQFPRGTDFQKIGRLNEFEYLLLVMCYFL